MMSLTSQAPENKTKRIVAYNMGDIKEIKKKGGGAVTKNKANSGDKEYKPVCMLCAPLRHWHSECSYDTPIKRRNKLVQVGRCQACTVLVVEHGRNCSHKARCRTHPGEKHVHWSCDGNNHPGPQEAIKTLQRNI